MIKSVAASVLILALCAPVFGAETAVLAIMDLVPEEISYQKASDISHIIRNEMRNLSGFRVLNRVQMVNSLGADTASDGGGRWRPGFGLGLAMHF